MKYPWMPMFWGDFFANTLHLSAQEIGAYVCLIAHAWEHDGKIEGSHARLARIARVRHDRWKSVWSVLENFFVLEPVGPLVTGPTDIVVHRLSHSRVIAELQRSDKISNKRKGAALQMHSKRDANAVQMHEGFHANAPTATTTTNIESSSVVSKEGGNGAPTVNYHRLAPTPGWKPKVDEADGYRSPPKTKSDNVLQPIPERPRAQPSGKLVELPQAAVRQGNGEATDANENA